MVNPQKSWDMYKTNIDIPNEMEDQEQTQPSIEQKTISPPDSQQNQSKSWDQYQTKDNYVPPKDPNGEETTFDWLLRNYISIKSRGEEAVLGGPGKLKNMGKSLFKKYPGAFGLIGWGLHNLMGQENWDKVIDVASGIDLPTPEDFRSLTELASGDYTKPRTKNEERAQQISSDIGTTLNPFTRITRPAVAFMNHLVTPLASNIVKESVEGMGFKSDKAETAKALTTLVLSLGSNVDARRFATEMVNRGRNGLPNFLNANILRYQARMNQMQNRVLMNDPRTALTQSQINGINNDIANGQTSIQALMNRYNAISAARRDRGLWAMSAGDRRVAVNSINDLQNAVRQEILDIGRAYPEAIQNWQQGNAALRIIHQSNTITNWVQGQLSSPLGKGIGAATGASALFGAKGVPALAGAATGAAAATYKSGQVLYRVMNNQNLRHYYFEAIAAAQAQNSVQFLKYYDKLDKALSKPDKRKKSTQ